jgi:hypothetical protein
MITFMIGLHKNCHMSDILVVLKIFNIHELYTLYKLIFIKNLKNNETCNTIFEYLCNNLNKFNSRSLSFARDLNNLTTFFNVNISEITNNIQTLISKFKTDTFDYDSDNEAFLFINNSLNNLNTGEHRKLLNFHLLNM